MLHLCSAAALYVGHKVGFGYCCCESKRSGLGHVTAYLASPPSYRKTPSPVHVSGSILWHCHTRGGVGSQTRCFLLVCAAASLRCQSCAREGYLTGITLQAESLPNPCCTDGSVKIGRRENGESTCTRSRLLQVVCILSNAWLASFVLSSLDTLTLVTQLQTSSATLPQRASGESCATILQLTSLICFQCVWCLHTLAFLHQSML